MTEEDIIRFVSGLAGVAVLTADEDTGAPESAWGDSFFYYDPDGDTPADRQMPFATIVTSNYNGFDEASNLNRDNVFRLNIGVGRRKFEELLGYPPAAHTQHADGYDYSVLDVLLPHPVYATHAWVSILNPDTTADRAKDLLVGAHARAAARHRPARD